MFGNIASKILNMFSKTKAISNPQQYFDIDDDGDDFAEY